jgi:hypothetical protein
MIDTIILLVLGAFIGIGGLLAIFIFLDFYQK